MAQTLWQRLRYGREKKPEEALYNPAETHLGAVVVVQRVGYENHYTLRGMDEYARGELKFCDYILEPRAAQRDTDTLRLRFVPISETKSDEMVTPAQLGHDIALLRLYDELTYDEDFVAALDKEEFIANDKGVETVYKRLNGLKTPHEARVTSVVEGRLPSSRNIRYWDWVTTALNAAKQPYYSLLFVEEDLSYHMFRLWTGPIADPSQITIL